MAEASDQRRSVTVIGAGSVGICCASYLQRAGLQDTVVGEHARGDALPSAWRAAAGLAFEPVGEEEIRQLVPGIAPEFTSGLFFPGTFQSINSFRLVQVLAEHFVHRGGTLLRRRVTGFELAMDGP